MTSSSRSFLLRAITGLLAVATAIGSPTGSALASCNLIPGAKNAFRSTRGVVDRPYAGPRDWLTITPGHCGGTPFAADDVVTVIFTPPHGPRSVVVLAPDQNRAGELSACAAESNLELQSASTPPLEVDGRSDADHLTLRFPDTTGSVSTEASDLPLTGPATIVVTAANRPLPCAAIQGTCVEQLLADPDTHACIDTLLADDGTCDASSHGIFNHFTALPPPNDYQALRTDVGEQSDAAHELRFTIDVDGNLLVPIDWRAILVNEDKIPFPRLIRAAINLEALGFATTDLGSEDRSLFGSYTIEGSKLPPVFDPQVGDEGAQPEQLILFGSADAPRGLLRIASRRPSRCVGGVDDGISCLVAKQCPQGTCMALCSDRTPCASDGDCSGGTCNPALFDLSERLFAHVGPIRLPQTGQCELPPSTFCSGEFTVNGACTLAVAACDPVSLDGIQQSAQLTAFVVSEKLSASLERASTLPDWNRDGDERDDVVKLANRATGQSLKIGVDQAPARAIARVHEDAFNHPALVVEDDVIAFLEPEATQDAPTQDKNGDGDVFDMVLRVFRKGAQGPEDLTGNRPPTAEAALMVDARSLALSKDLVFFRTAESDEGKVETRLVSVPTKPRGRHAASVYPAISGNGRYVAYSTASSRQVFRDSNDVADIFVRDLATNTTRRVSINARGNAAKRPPGYVGYPDRTPAISADGRFVAFASPADNLVRRDDNRATDIFLHDRDADGNGIFDQKGKYRRGATRIDTIRVNVSSPDGIEANAESDFPTMSPDGRFVAFASLANNLVADDTNGMDEHGTPVTPYSTADVFVRDLCRVDGVPVAPCDPHTERVSLDSDEHQTSGQHAYGRPAISADGRFVAFASGADELVHAGDIGLNQDGVDDNHTTDVFVRDRIAGSTERVSLGTRLQEGEGFVEGNDWSYDPAISADGRFVAFTSNASNLVDGDTNGAPDIFVHDRVTRTTVRINVSSDGRQANGAFSGLPAISADGRRVVFASDAGDLVGGPPVTGCVIKQGVCDGGSHAGDVCVFDGACPEGRCAPYCLGGDTPNQPCEDADDCPGGGFCRSPSCTDVFLHDLLTGITERASGPVTPGASAEWWRGHHPAISLDGKFVAFDGFSVDFPGHDLGNVYLRGVGAPHGPAGDLTGNDQVADTVLRVFDTTTQNVIGPACPATQVAVAEGRAVFLRPESSGAAPGRSVDGVPAIPCPEASDACRADPTCRFSLNGDTDDEDEVVHLWSEGSVQNLGIAARAIAISSTLVAALVSEPGEGADHTVVEILPNGSSEWRVLAAADHVQALGSIVAFVTPEAARGGPAEGCSATGGKDGTDLNGDGDCEDRVLQIFAGGSAALNTGYAVEEIVLGGKPGAELVAFRTMEASQGTQVLNHDGDHSDGVLLLYDVAKGCVVSTGSAVTPCDSEACDPRVPYRVGRDTVTFLTKEADQGCHLGSDVGLEPDLDDLVLQIFQARGPSVRCVDDSAASIPDPCGPTDGNSTRTLGAVSTGLCTTDGTACANDSDCEGGTCFLPPGGCIKTTAGATCRPADADPGCAVGDFCEPIPDGSGAGQCKKVVGPCTGGAASCTALQACSGEACVCNAGVASFQRLVDPLTTPRGGGALYTSAGHCVEHLDAGPDACADHDVRLVCQREHGSCRTADDCPPRAVCEPDLVVIALNDADRDEIPDPLDNCPNAPNPGQEDTDGNGIGNACQAP